MSKGWVESDTLTNWSTCVNLKHMTTLSNTLSAANRHTFNVKLQEEEALFHQHELNEKQNSGAIQDNSRRSKLIILRGDIKNWNDGGGKESPVDIALRSGLITSPEFSIPKTRDRVALDGATVAGLNAVNRQYRDLRDVSAIEWRNRLLSVEPELLRIRLAKYVWWDFAAAAEFDIELNDLVEKELTNEEVAEVSGEDMAIGLWVLGYPAIQARRRAGLNRKPVVVAAQSPLQMAILQVLNSGSATTVTCAKAIQKPTAAANSALNSLLGRGIVRVEKKVEGLEWSLA